MVTLLLVFILAVVICFLIAIITGIIAISPIMLTIIGLLLLDLLFFKILKCVFKKKT